MVGLVFEVRISKTAVLFYFYLLGSEASLKPLEGKAIIDYLFLCLHVCLLIATLCCERGKGNVIRASKKQSFPYLFVIFLRTQDAVSKGGLNGFFLKHV